MLRFEFESSSAARLRPTTFESLNLYESALQNLIYKNQELTLEEMDESGLLLLKPEVFPSTRSRDRIDLLGLDTDGTAVVIELKRGKHKGHLAQAISYASMVSQRDEQWFLSQIDESDANDLRGRDGEVLLNKKQRIILIAEDFDSRVIIAANWMKNFHLNIKCLQIKVYEDKHNSANGFISFTQVFPSEYIDHIVSGEVIQMPGELDSLFGSLRGYFDAKFKSPGSLYPPFRSDRNVGGGSFETQADNISSLSKNVHLLAFIENWIQLGEKVLPDSGYRLVYPRRRERWRIQPRLKYAWVMQSGRFTIDDVSDEDFWKERLHDPNSVNVRRDGRRLHFNLHTEMDFKVFMEAITTKLDKVSFSDR